MMAAEQRPFLAQLPLAHSRYLEVLRGGFMLLRFPPDIEHEYRAARDPALRHRLAASALAGIVAVTAWMLLDFFGNREFQFPAARLILLGWMLPLLGLLALVAIQPNRGRPVPGAIVLAIDAGLALGFVYLQILMETRGLPGARFPFEALLVLLFGFFLSGMMTFRAVTAGVIAVGAFLAGTVISGVPPAVNTDDAVLFLVVTVLLGTAGSWRIEHSDRLGFLMARLLRTAAEHDGLTNLLNHSAFVAHCNRAWRQAARDGRPVGLLMTDIDHFKAYNDCYGHAAGDRCLQRVAQVVGSAAGRGLDAAGRMGGEEFAVFFYGMPGERLAEAAERLQRGVEALHIEHAESDTARWVTVSVGAAGRLPGRGDTLREAMRAADAGLYAAKAAGRNRTHVERPG